MVTQHEETRVLPGERYNARNNARCTQATKTAQDLDGQHQYVDRTPREDSLIMTEDRDTWTRYFHCVANSWIEDS